MTAGSYYYWLHVFHRIIHNRQLKSLSYQIIQHDTRMVYPACYFLQRYQNNTGNNLRRVTIISIILILTLRMYQILSFKKIITDF
ncbi:unnamed protein product [Tenebrio molitor]|nr:unnamed protein product [Tenebrio molitor]